MGLHFVFLLKVWIVLVLQLATVYRYDPNVTWGSGSRAIWDVKAGLTRIPNNLEFSLLSFFSRQSFGRISQVPDMCLNFGGSVDNIERWEILWDETNGKFWETLSWLAK